jgi:hypothetical protein
MSLFVSLVMSLTMLAASPGSPSTAKAARAEREAKIRDDPGLSLRNQKAGTMIRGGVSILAAGVASVLVISLPLYAASKIARTRAGSEPILAEEEELLERANRREVASIVIGSLGGALVITGIVLASVGGSRRAAVRREAEQARFGWDPRGLTLRF